MSVVEQQIAEKISEEFSKKKLLSPGQVSGLIEKICSVDMSASDWRTMAELSIKEEERNAATQTPNS